MEKQTQKKNTHIKAIIITLVILLILSAGGLAARYIYINFFANTQTTATVPDNLIGDDNKTATESGDTNPSDAAGSSGGNSASSAASSNTGNSEAAASNISSSPAAQAGTRPVATSLELYAGHPGDNEKFEATNMLPGDSETKYFCVKTHHAADISIYFNIEVTEQTKALGDVLHIKVTHLDTGKVLCDGAFNEVKDTDFAEALTKNSKNETVSYYQVEVSLDTSVGNEYQAAMLKSDFNWYVTAEDETHLTNPQPKTGDFTNITLWIVLGAASLMLMILMLKKRRDDTEEDKLYE